MLAEPGGGVLIREGRRSPGASAAVAGKGRTIHRSALVPRSAGEEAVGLTKVVPFLVEDELKRLRGLYEKGPDWAPFVITDGRLVTGQNPASSTAGAKALLKPMA